MEMATKKENESLVMIKILKKKITELETKYEKLRATVGYEELQGWKPNPQIESQYGWVYAWLYPLNTFLNNNLHQQLTPDIRNKAVNIVTAIIAQLTLNGKYGIQIPNEPNGTSGFFDKQIKYYELNYDPCDICGENRITHQCHIIPRVDGGIDRRENMVTLCPLHHHLFDHHRLNKEEWEILVKVIETREQSALIYAKEVREKQLQEFWANPKRIYPKI